MPSGTKLPDTLSAAWPECSIPARPPTFPGICPFDQRWDVALVCDFVPWSTGFGPAGFGCGLGCPPFAKWHLLGWE